jgi:hypothetical protein
MSFPVNNIAALERDINTYTVYTVYTVYSDSRQTEGDRLDARRLGVHQVNSTKLQK